MTHLQQRLKERDIKNISDSELWTIARKCAMDSAVILLNLDSHVGDSSGNYCQRKESNGDLVVLIVRDSRPVTIMYRRSSQTNTANQLRVNQVIDLTN